MNKAGDFGLYRYVTRTNVPFIDLTPTLGLRSKNEILSQNCTFTFSLFMLVITNLVSRLFLRGRKNLGRSWSRDAYKIDCLRGYGQSVKLHMLPLPDFTLSLQGVSVLYIRL